MESDSSDRWPADSGTQDDLDRQQRKADERDRRADARDADLDAREELAAAREAGQADRDIEANHILAGAAGRDQDADTRDLVATERDEVASRHAFISQRGAYGVALDARRSAAMDRLDSKPQSVDLSGNDLGLVVRGGSDVGGGGGRG